MPLVSIDDLTALAAAALKAHGASDAMARTTAKYLVAANVQGLATHGVMRVASYCGHLDVHRAVGAAVPEIIHEKPAACLIDAGNGLGFEACELAVQQALARARTQGTGFAGVTNSHHCGALGILLEPVAAAGMVGLAFSNASAAIMPWGGTRPLFGTNPVAAIFGRRNAPPIVVDLSLTQVTRGQIMLNVKAGKPLPEGWGMDKDGKPTTDRCGAVARGCVDAHQRRAAAAPGAGVSGGRSRRAGRQRGLFRTRRNAGGGDACRRRRAATG